MRAAVYDAIMTGCRGILVAWAAGCLALISAAGCAGMRSPAATGQHAQARPAHSASATARTPPVRAFAARYLAIAVPGNRRLDIDFDRLEGRDRADLPAARADLRDIAATELLFDHRLLGITFPPAIERIARLLVQANQARAGLTATVANSPSLTRLRAGQPRLDAANGPVEDAVQVLRGQLSLPPPDTS